MNEVDQNVITCRKTITSIAKQLKTVKVFVYLVFSWCFYYTAKHCKCSCFVVNLLPWHFPRRASIFHLKHVNRGTGVSDGRRRGAWGSGQRAERGKRRRDVLKQQPHSSTSHSCSHLAAIHTLPRPDSKDPTHTHIRAPGADLRGQGRAREDKECAREERECARGDWECAWEDRDVKSRVAKLQEYSWPLTGINDWE